MQLSLYLLGFVKTSINGVIESKNTYNDQNQLIMKQDALGNESIYRYDALGRVIYSDEKGYITRKGIAPDCPQMAAISQRFDYMDRNLFSL